MKKIIEQITKLENGNTGYNYNVTKVLLNEDKANKLVEQLENEEISLLEDLECYDEIIYTDKLNWMEFIYLLKNKIDQINYLDNMDNFHFDQFREMIKENVNTITFHYNDKLDLGIIKYDFDNVIIFDEEHDEIIEKMLKNKVEAYFLPKYDKNVIEQIIEEF